MKAIDVARFAAFLMAVASWGVVALLVVTR
jgi:hypothetical protein